MPDTTQNQRDPLLEILSQINCLGLGLLWSGLTILSKDLIEFLSVGAYDNAAVNRFRQIYIKAFNEDRSYWEIYGPELYRPLSELEMPSGFAARAAQGDFNMEALLVETDDLATGKKGILHRWTHYPGWEFSKQAGIGLSVAICRMIERDETGYHPVDECGFKLGTERYKCDENGNGGTGSVDGGQPNDQNGGLSSLSDEQKKLNLELARKILCHGFADEPFWYPITVYIAHLLVRTGYEHFCEAPVMNISNNSVVTSVG